ncbi:MAG: molybdopterin-dependent oxidoreductase, partial [Actinomycetota bacterium]
GAIDKYKDEENSDWKFLMFDADGDLKLPKGTLGYRWAQDEGNKGKWNLELKDGVDNSEIDPLLTLKDSSDEVVQIDVIDFGGDKVLKRGVPVRHIDTADGKVAVATCFDLIMAHYGIDRDLGGEYPKDYNDDSCFTPAWQERYTGIDRDTIIKFAQEWATTAEKTGGKCMIIIGAGINHWYHSNLMYKSGIVTLMLTGCVGVNGGGLNHYVGQEKLAPMAPWATIAMGLDWSKPPRLQNAPSFHYIHSDQWRYEKDFTDYCAVPEDEPLATGHAADMQVKAVKNGWLPFFPQFDRNSIDLAREAEEAGAGSNEEISAWVARQLAEGKVNFSVEDPDAPENWPRVWFIWRGNALMSSAKGHEYFLKHYLGTHHNAIAEERAQGSAKDVVWREAPEGKLDLVVDLNFRMDTSALYSDVVLPAATWYEKGDLNSTDMHSFIHPLSEAVSPAWESRSDWD